MAEYISQSGKYTYARYYGNFGGLDCGDAKNCAATRFPHLVNMWRDWDDDGDGAVETIPGFRRLLHGADIGLSGAVNGIFRYRAQNGAQILIAHIGTGLCAYDVRWQDALSGSPSPVAVLSNVMANTRSRGFSYAGKYYLLDGTHYYRVNITVSVNGEITAFTVADAATFAYEPLTWHNGDFYEQRNMLSDNTREEETRGGVAFNLSDIVKLSAIARVTGFCGSYSCSDLYIAAVGNVIPQGIEASAFAGNTDITNVYINVTAQFTIYASAFTGCTYLTDIYFSGSADNLIFNGGAPEGVQIHYASALPAAYAASGYLFTLHDPAVSVRSVKVDGETVSGLAIYRDVTLAAGVTHIITGVMLENKHEDNTVTIAVTCAAGKFSRIGDLADFLTRNNDSGISNSIDAIKGCRLCAVYDDRVFLSGNPKFPNTVFWSNRDAESGLNNPSYFGIYNWVNDGSGSNTVVSLLSSSSMLMIIKSPSNEEPGIYYHSGVIADADDPYKNLIPRKYPSVGGASDVGGVGASCCFRDDPVFLTSHGLDAVGKQTVNLERSISHRSSNVDLMLRRESLSSAVMCEWNGYLCICANGHIYMADSRQIFAHPSGDNQYEWYYLEGIGTYAIYSRRFMYMSGFPVDSDGVSIAGYSYGGQRLDTVLSILDSDEIIEYGDVSSFTATHGDNSITVYYYDDGAHKYLLDYAGDEMKGSGTFYPANVIYSDGGLLYFGDGGGDICIFNTDKRGVAYGGESVAAGKIHRHWYSFNGVAYTSGCSTCLDDCDVYTVSKNTLSGTCILNVKPMDNSRFSISVSTDGAIFDKLGDFSASPYNYANLNYNYLYYGGEECGTVLIPEYLRGWLRKQYYIYSDNYCSPFGLYGLGYHYRRAGKYRG